MGLALPGAGQPDSRSVHARPGSEASLRRAQHRARPASALPGALRCWTLRGSVRGTRGSTGPATPSAAEAAALSRGARGPSASARRAACPRGVVLRLSARGGTGRALLRRLAVHCPAVLTALGAARSGPGAAGIRSPGHVQPAGAAPGRGRPGRRLPAANRRVPGPERGRVPLPPGPPRDLSVRAARPRACPRPPGGTPWRP